MSWSCEHCGRPEDQAARACVGCGGEMCFGCAEKHDADGNSCPTPPMWEPSPSSATMMIIDNIRGGMSDEAPEHDDDRGEMDW